MDVDQVLDNPPSDRVYNYVPIRDKKDFKNEIDAFLDEEQNGGSSDDSGSSDEEMGPHKMSQNI